STRRPRPTGPSRGSWGCGTAPSRARPRTGASPREGPTRLSLGPPCRVIPFNPSGVRCSFSTVEEGGYSGPSGSVKRRKRPPDLPLAARQTPEGGVEQDRRPTERPTPGRLSVRTIRTAPWLLLAVPLFLPASTPAQQSPDPDKRFV